MAPPTSGWPDTRVTRLLSLERPIVQGPFGGGLSSVALAAAVADAGGLGSFGAHHLDPAEIRALGRELHAATDRPFALNLWASTHDLPEAAMTRERFGAAVRRLQPLYDEVGAGPPPYPERFAAPFEEQAEAVLDARPAAFSFVFGVPDERVLAAFRDAGIVTLGTATTPDEAVALDAAGIDIVVASGAEAGGHRGAFLAPAEESLVGTLPLVRIAVEEVEAPVIAAGGIADARGIVAALALGAEGVQIGTAFLATDESGATAEHKAALLGGARRTLLTRAFSGRLARGIPNALAARLPAVEPYPYHGHLVRPILQAMWSGQAAPLLKHRTAAALFSALADNTDRFLAASYEAPFR
jgi:nitronate monooxygenase